ncbi:Polysaccharide pyruvyl transferase [Bacteroides faecichinchillae]|uniref:Polysaccharide pyruvyl transferase n=1 Tax=Bacteroides faecichinchillae TaxID=871325 RepID=A0A1M5B378_9BACE|nr:polysaccharide pyruvyl transferase family protein [Bacteroides faecichinchillae]SHF36908.1 Polysaccharide pyruvyl transferase [Bacteroides faecichinchillae]
MNNLLFTYEGFDKTNIGDYIQSLAAKQFIPKDKDITYVHRDYLNEIDSTSKVIMNGWFTHIPENWPPSDLISPLFVAFHINSSAYEKLLSSKSIDYLRQHEPIGCRDKNTADILQSHGIDSYFSSCLTTTLGYKYHSNKKNEKIYVVDAVHYVPESNRRFQKYKFYIQYLIYYKGISKFINSARKNNPYIIDFKDHYDRFCCIVRSYMIIRQLIPRKEMDNVEILTQYHDASEIPSNEERFARAEELLHKYSEARLVITSRIHCALPCLGLETPVLFLRNLDDSDESTCRFKGLLDLLNVVQFKRNRIINSPFNVPLDIQSIANPTRYKKYAEKLIKKCMDFWK